jgi:hypothetical protein
LQEYRIKTGEEGERGFHFYSSTKQKREGKFYHLAFVEREPLVVGRIAGIVKFGVI